MVSTIVLGGGPNPPVILDPAQIIVEVHWASPFMRVAYGLALDMTPEGERGIGPGPALVEPFSEAFVSEATPVYTSSGVPNVSVWAGGEWENVNPDDVVIAGTPELPSAVAFDDWEVQGITAGGSFAPLIRFIEEAGTPPEINLPDADDYVTSLVPNGEIVAQNFISGPQPLPVGGDVPLWATFDPTLVQKDTFSVNVADLTATYKERIYEPIATRVSGAQFSVLMKRQALPPSP